MAGKPFRVGRFAHTLRVRLMREHLGIDVDALLEEDLIANDPQPTHKQQPCHPDVEQSKGQKGGVTQVGKSKQKTSTGIIRTMADAVEQGWSYTTLDRKG
jgi:phospholipase D1/2